jgi:3-oxoacyl-[acyl-carrier protein] reductase
LDLGLKDKVAVVAAASGGLGFAVALGLSREGAKVAICSRDEARIEAAAELIRSQTGGEVFAASVDVTDESQVHSFVVATEQQFGRVDIGVSNCGGPASKKFDQTTTTDWEKAYQTSFLSTLYFAQALLPGMRERRWGRFLTITSSAVKQPLDGLILSNSVRSAVSGLVKSLSNEYGPDNVLIHNVCPGFTATDRLMSLAEQIAGQENITVDQVVARWAGDTALKRIGTPEEFADTVVFLASERASYLTGTSLAVDGGRVRGVFS